MHRVGVRDERGDERMAGLVVRDDVLLLVGEDVAPALDARRQPVGRLLEVGSLDLLLVAPRGQERGLVHQVGEVGAREAGRTRRDPLQVDVGPDLDLARVDLEDLHAAAQVRQVDDDAAVEAAGAQQRRGRAPRGGSWPRGG